MQTIRRSVEYANAIVDFTNSNYTTMLPCCTGDNFSFMLLQALHVEIEMKNLKLNHQAALLVQKGVETPFPPHCTPACLESDSTLWI